MSAQTQFYKGIIIIGGTQYPCLPTASFNCPENFIVPPVIGNYWQWNYAEGFLQPAVDLTFLCRDKVGEVMDLTFFNNWLSRTSDAAHDTTAMSGGLKFWDGRSGFTLGGCKADSFTLSCSKGQLLSFTGRFLFNAITALGAAPAFTAWDNSAPLTFKAVNANGVLANEMWNFGLSFSNNHTPDMSLNQSNLPADNNAGMMTAGVNYEVQAAKLVVPDNNQASSLGGGTDIEIVIAGANVSRLFTLSNPIDQLAKNRSIGQGRVMRQHSYICLGGDGQTTPPLVIT